MVAVSTINDQNPGMRKVWDSKKPEVSDKRGLKPIYVKEKTELDCKIYTQSVCCKYPDLQLKTHFLLWPVVLTVAVWTQLNCI